MVSRARGSQKAREALEFLRDRISRGDWPVGALIPTEPELMEQMAAGRSTVREAVRSLATLGMLETVPGVGTFVRARTPVASILSEFLVDQDLEEVLIYRRSLEIEAAQSAAVRRSDEQLAVIAHTLEHAETQRCLPGEVEDTFHRRIVEASGSQLLLELYDGVMHVLRQAALHDRIFIGATEATCRADHEAILEALRERNVRKAAHSMALHVDRDLGFRVESDMLDVFRETERVSTLREAGFDPARTGRVSQ